MTCRCYLMLPSIISSVCLVPCAPTLTYYHKYCAVSRSGHYQIKYQQIIFHLSKPLSKPLSVDTISTLFAQVCFEGHISKETIDQSFTRASRASGDLVPWTLSQQVRSNNKTILLYLYIYLML